ncbi:glycosyl hydrolase family 95 catalytic domain-containing protein [Mangrovihabitans endophyticus]|uniref:glycosyl hydrolase family 95 catalytic domain-containing protein n=1 Tax=Mangrovihabitans endophyticus TaxID=1751298 RepID=UPI0016648A62|nr:hypothetical protein [Mangrovihabitans endophyticus]
MYTEPGRSELSFALGPADQVRHGRAPVLRLRPPGALSALTVVLDPWDAEATFAMTTAEGRTELTALVQRSLGVLMISWSGDAGPTGWSAERPGTGETALDCREMRADGRTLLLVATHPQALADAAAESATALIDAHRGWWHRFYRQSFVRLTDRAVQRFHWLQQYAAAATTPPGILPAGRFPQLLIGTGHLDLGPRGEPGTSIMAGNPLAAGMPGVGSKAGRAEHPVAAWGLHRLWSIWQHGGDPGVVENLLYPGLKRAVELYAGFLRPGPDGHLHLPLTHSPGWGDVADCSHDLAALRWSLRTLLSLPTSSERDAAARSRWGSLMERLVPLHRDGGGVMVGAGVPLTRPVADPAHLAAIYPYRESNWLEPADRELMRRDVGRWAARRDGWTAASHAAAAALFATTRDGEAAADCLAHLLDAADSTLAAGASDHDAGVVDQDAWCTAGQALLDMLVQGDRGVVDVFPAIPARWPDLTVAGLRAPGRLMIDAVRADGRTGAVRVRGTPGREVILRHGISGTVLVHDGAGRTLPVAARNERTVVLRLPASGVAVVADRRIRGANFVPSARNRPSESLAEEFSAAGECATP